MKLLAWARAGGRPLVLLASGAVLFRLLMFLGRGDYIAYDEGFYLLLGRSLWAGDGYHLSGLRHVALSPLFPMLAGGLSRLLGDLVWSGRIVAAVAGGLLVIPCWSIFHRIAGRRAALLGCALIAVMPALTPFVVPYWIRWDLWVGAEPVLQLFLFGGIALFLKAMDSRGPHATKVAWGRDSRGPHATGVPTQTSFAWGKANVAWGRDSGRPWHWLLAGSVFSLAYLARPEAIIPAGLLGLAGAVIALRQRRASLAVAVVGFGVAFAAVAAPYWLYLHDVLGGWTLTGRGVHLELAGRLQGQRASAGDPALIIERMLWGDDQTPYLRNLYSLDASGTRLLSPYWGLAPAEDAPAAAQPGAGQPDPPEPSAAPNPSGDAQGRTIRPRLVFYGRALGIGIPWFLWPFVVAGIVWRRRRRDLRELLFAGPLAAASVAVAAIIAVDPRTQLFIVPMLAYYAQRGIRLAAVGIERGAEQPIVRRGFIRGLAAAVAITLLLGINARRLYLSVAVGSPHHIVGAENRQVGESLQQWVEPDEPIMSWHPAIALYAERDWRVLPAASLPQIARYAALVGVHTAVLSVYYPAPLPELPAHYLALMLPADAALRARWRFEPIGEEGDMIIARLEPVP